MVLGLGLGLNGPFFRGEVGAGADSEAIFGGLVFFSFSEAGVDDPPLGCL